MIDKRLSHILLVLYLFFLTHGDRLVRRKDVQEKEDRRSGERKKMTKDTKKMAEGREGRRTQQD